MSVSMFKALIVYKYPTNCKLLPLKKMKLE